MKTILAVLFICVCLFSGYVAFILGGRTIVDRGSYGPFTIGEEKAVSAQTLRQLQAWPPKAIAPHREWRDSPNFAELERVFGKDEGILVSFAARGSIPTQLEFEGDTLVKYWPNFTPKTFPYQPPQHKAAYEAFFAFQERLEIGMTRESVFRILAQSRKEIGTSVSAGVAGWQRFERMSQDERAADPTYADFVYSKSGWNFDGLRSLVWYSNQKEPFYSIVSLYFDNDRLVRVEHRHGPVRLK